MAVAGCTDEELAQRFHDLFVEIGELLRLAINERQLQSEKDAG